MGKRREKLRFCFEELDVWNIALDLKDEFISIDITER